MCHFGIDRKRVRNGKNKGRNCKAKKKRLEGGGRKAALSSVEEEVVIWIDEMRAEISKLLEHAFNKWRLASFALRENRISLPAGVDWRSFVGNIRCHCVEGQQ